MYGTLDNELYSTSKCDYDVNKTRDFALMWGINDCGVLFYAVT